MIMKKLLFTICALLAVGSTFATNTFSINTVYASTSGISTIEVNYSLDAGFACGGFSFDLQLPDEFEFVGKNAYTPGDCYASTPTFTTNLTAAGVLKIAYATSDPLTKQSGTLASFQIRAKSSAVAGNTYTGGSLTAAKFVDNSTSASANAADVPFNIVATDRVVLDEESTILPVAQSGVDVLVKRSIKKDVWNTICLPFVMNQTKATTAFGADAKYAQFDGYSVDLDMDTFIPNSITIHFTAYELGGLKTLKAGNPYLIMTKDDISQFEVSNVTIVKDVANVSKPEKNYEGALADGVFKGTFIKTVIPENGLFLSGNKFYYSVGTTNMKGFRGWFDLGAVIGKAIDVGAPLYLDFDGETTKIDPIQLYPNDGYYYDLNGMKIENPTKKGVYIQNGKKVVIKK